MANITYTFSPNTRIKSSEVNQDFQDVLIDWQSWSPTLVGWSGTPTSVANYFEQGKMIGFYLMVNGTSNSTTTSFTLPVMPSFSGGLNIPLIMNRASNNGAYLASAPFADIQSGSLTVLCYVDATGNSWTAANAKFISVQGFYPIA